MGVTRLAKRCRLVFAEERSEIRCIIDVLGEYAREESQAAGSVEAYMTAAKSIAENGLDASLTVKLSALGALFDQERCQQNVQTIAREAARLGVGFEIDMEGRPLVTYTIDVAAACAKEGRVSLALQAYLDRSRDDVVRASESGIIARIVKERTWDQPRILLIFRSVSSSCQRSCARR